MDIELPVRLLKFTQNFIIHCCRRGQGRGAKRRTNHDVHIKFRIQNKNERDNLWVNYFMQMCRFA